MTHKKVTSTNKKLLIIILCFYLFSCLCICLFLDGSALPFKTCYPTIYNQTERVKIEGYRVSYVTNDSIEEVLSFYDSHLPDLEYDIISPGYTGRWKKQYYPGYVRYNCYGNDINFVTGTAGCIYISEDERGTVIEVIRYTSRIQCPLR